MEQKQINYLIRLSKGGFYKKKQFKKIFNNYILTGKDLLMFLSFLKEERGFGQSIKKTVLNWIYSHQPCFLEKELSQSFKDFDGLTILRLFHPKPLNNKFQKAFLHIKENCKELRNIY